MSKCNEKFLVCYYITDNKKINESYIRNYLKNKIPLYMIPKYFVKIDSIPVTGNGKLDRKALPEPNFNNNEYSEYIAPETDIEKIICKVYSYIFNIPLNEIGKMHNFYELGGDSLNVNHILIIIEKELKIKLYIKDIMNHPVIYDLSKYIESILTNNKNREYNKVEIIPKYNRKEFQITSQQLGIYIDSIEESNSINYNIPSIYKLNSNIDKKKIKKAFLKIFEKQEILKSRYEEKVINGKTEIYGIIDDECSLKFEEYSYNNIGTFIRPFDLNKAPLIRVGFIENEYLLIDMHHIISDGTTMSIIIDELNKYYKEEEIEELEIQYSDYAINLNEKKNNGKLNEQIEIYKEIFSNEYEILNIPTRNKIINNEYKIKEKKIIMKKRVVNFVKKR